MVKDVKFPIFFCCILIQVGISRYIFIEVPDIKVLLKSVLVGSALTT